jgi:cell division protein FtsI (penicillin-binding protein 3)
LPDFDPAQVGQADDEQVFNRMSLGVYELGSMFKIFSTAALIETQENGMNMRFDASKPIQFGRFRISDYHAENRILSVPEVFMHSSNIGAALMGKTVGTEKLQAFYRDLGLMSPVDFEIREVGAPLLPNPWRELNTLTASYGHGIATSPLQLATAVSMIVNGGYAIKPTMVMNDAAQTQKGARLRVLSQKTSEEMRELMRLVVTEGTGKSAEVAGYHIGGKTGTAEKPGAHGYDRKRLMSSFVGMFPAENPKYAVLVVVDEPHGNKASYGYATGGWVAAPAVARVVASMASIMGLPAEDESNDDPADALASYVQGEDGTPATFTGGQLVSYRPE